MDLNSKNIVRLSNKMYIKVIFASTYTSLDPDFIAKSSISNQI